MAQILRARTITFDSGPGGSAVKPQTVLGRELLKEPVPFRAGFAYAGWYLTDGTKWDFSVMPPFDINFTLYARWVCAGSHDLLWTVTVAAAETVNGSETGNCAICAHTETRTLWATGTHGLDYELTGSGGYRVRAGSVTSGEVFIPAYYRHPGSTNYSDYLPVTEIGAAGDAYGGGAFQMRTAITAMSGGANIRAVNNYAFSECSSLTSASFPAATIIGEYAFSYCDNLLSASFQEVTIIGEYAFSYCDNLQSVSFPKAASIGREAFSYCASLPSASFPEVTSIGEGAFMSSSVRDVSFPKVAIINGYTFEECYSLTSVSFPSVTSIGVTAFAFCDSLTSASFPKAEFIGVQAFAYSGLQSASFPEATRISAEAFNACYYLQNVYFPKAETIDTHTFAETGLQSASFPEAAIIRGSAFVECTSLTSISLPKAASIGDAAFEGCNALASIAIAAGTNISAVWHGAGTRFGDFITLYEGNGRQAGVYTYTAVWGKTQ